MADAKTAVPDTAPAVVLASTTAGHTRLAAACSGKDNDADRVDKKARTDRDTGLFRFTARRVVDCTQAQFDALKKRVNVLLPRDADAPPFSRRRYTQMDVDTQNLLRGFSLPEDVTDKARLQPNENCSDVLVLSFDDQSHSGALIIADRGVWTIAGGEYPWRMAQDVDILPSFRDDGSVQLDALK
jgi:hypothetical protein